MKTPLVPHWVKEVAKRATADAAIRPTLACVHLSPSGRIEATNSFLAVSVDAALTAEEKAFDLSKFPDVGSEPLREIPDSGLLIPSATIKELRFKRSKFVECLDRKAMLSGYSVSPTQNGASHSVTLNVTDLDTVSSVRSRLSSGAFPNLEAFFRSAEGAEPVPEIAVSVQYLIDVLEIFKASGHDKAVLKPRGANGLLIESVVEGTLGKDVSARALIMPVKL